MKIIDVQGTVEAIFKVTKENGITVRELANKLGVTNMAIYNWKNLGRLPKIDNLVMLTEILNVTLDDIIKTKTF